MGGARPTRQRCSARATWLRTRLRTRTVACLVGRKHARLAKFLKGIRLLVHLRLFMLRTLGLLSTVNTRTVDKPHGHGHDPRVVGDIHAGI
jgi:hypothetical protein